MGIFYRHCADCGAEKTPDHLCDDPGPAAVGSEYTACVASGIYRAPSGEYLVTAAVAAEVLGEEAGKRLLDRCLDADGCPTEDDLEAARGRYASSLARLRSAVELTRAAQETRRDAA